MGLVQFFRILWARRSILLLTTLSCLVGAVLIARALPARYLATSRVMLDIVKPDPVTGEVIASGFARAYVKTQIELIRDYRVAGKVVDQLGWTSSPELSAAYERRPASDTRDFRRWLAQQVIDNTSASLIDTSNILEIRYSTTSADAAARVSDAIRQAYIDQAVSFRRDDAANNANWFRQQATRIRAELAAAEKRKADFERANGVVLEDNNTDVESSRLTALAAASAAGPTPSAPVSVGGANPGDAQLAQANVAVANAQRTLGPNNPELQAMIKQRDAIAASAASSRVVTRAGGPTGPSLSSLYSAQQAKVLAQRGKVGEARQLGADVAVLRDQYAKTAARAADLEQQGQSTESGLTLLGSAVAPQSPAFPKWPLIIFGSIALGLVLGILVSLVAELLARRVRGIEDLRLPGIPVLGMMARAPRRRTGLFSRLNPFSRPQLQGV